jgi:hypothetical protein
MRWGHQYNAQIPTDPGFPSMRLAYFLMGPGAGDASTCGRGGSLGDMDLTGDGNLIDRGGAPVGDACDMVGRGRFVGQCAEEWVVEKPDWNPHSATYQMDTLWERDHRCKVILLDMSAMWCGPCRSEAQDARDLYHEYKDVDGDGEDDFMIIAVIIADESNQAPDADDIRRWAEGDLPSYGISGWDSGDLDFPVFADGARDIWGPWGSTALPTNIVIGADFVTDFYQLGWGSATEAAARCCIEKNLCETLPSDFVMPVSGARCDQPFQCEIYDGSNWVPVCEN